jgi:ketosteroid isomerase-like protein
MRRVLPFYTPDAVAQPGNAPPATGSAQIRSLHEEFFRLPVTAFGREPTKVEVSAAGDMAYLVGNNYLTLATPAGPVSDTGKYMAVFRKTSEGWRVAAVSYSSNKPVSVPPTEEAGAREGIARANREWAEGLMQRNVGMALGAYTDDIVLSMGGRTYRGRGEVEDLIESILARENFENVRHSTEELTVVGATAFEIGQAQWLAVAPSGARSPRRSRYFGEWQRQADGAWRLRRAVADLSGE